MPWRSHRTARGWPWEWRPARGESPIYLISLAEGRIERVLKGTPRSLWRMEFSPDGRLLAREVEDRTARFWNLETGATTTSSRAISTWCSTCVFARGKKLATASF